MLIKSILTSLVNTVRSKHMPRAVDPTAKSAATSAKAGELAGPAAAFRQIAAEYDVTNISPRKLSEMLLRLRDAAAISNTEFQELSAMRTDLDQQHIGPDQSINLVDFYRQRLQQLEGQLKTPAGEAAGDSSAQASVEAVQRRLEWLGKVAAAASPLGRKGLDWTA